MRDDIIEFECEWCSSMFRDLLFDISREYGRVHYRSPSSLEQVEVKGSESIANFYSRKCRAQKRLAVMAAQRVPIPAKRPSLGPVESCAKCCGPVDMSGWHLTFVESDMDLVGDSFSPLDVTYLAVVCNKCAHFRAKVALAYPIDESNSLKKNRSTQS